MARRVKNISTALSRTNRPVKVPVGDGLENVVAGLGTDRDKRSYTQWGLPRTLTRNELENMYECSWLSKRIVNTVADDMTQKWRTFTFADGDENPRVTALQLAEKQFSVQDKFNEAIKWARLYGGAVIVLGTRDITSPESFATTLNVERIRQGDLKYMHVLDRWRVAPSGRRTTDMLSPNFGLPESYIIAESSVEVHWTRLLRFDGQKVPYFVWQRNGWWHDSELQHVVDSLTNYDTTAAALASMMFEANIDVVQSENLAELLSTKEGEAKLIKRFQLGALMKSFNRTLVLDSSEKYEKKQNQFANLDKVWEKFMVDVCGACDIPMTRLFGQSPGGLNATGTGDLENYYTRINADQSTRLKPKLDYFDEIFVRSVLGIKPVDYAYKFNSLWQISDKDRAAIEYQDAQRDQIYLQSGVVSEGLVASQLRLKGTYATMSDEDVRMAEELSEEMDSFQSEQRTKLTKPTAEEEPDEPAATSKEDK